MDTVDVPEKIGIKGGIGPFDMYQLMRIVVYLLAISLLSLYISVFVSFFSIVAVFAVYKKRGVQDLDLYFYSFLLYLASKKQFDVSSTSKLVTLKDVSNSVAETYDRFEMVLEVSGINLEYFSEEDQKKVYLAYLSMLNSINFDFEIKIFASNLKFEEFGFEHLKLEKLKEEYAQLIHNLTMNRVSYRYFIILSYKYLEFKGSYNRLERRQKASEILDTRANMIITNLKNIGVVVHKLEREELFEFYKFIVE